MGLQAKSQISSLFHYAALCKTALYKEETMNDVLRILIVEDQSDDYALAQREIRKVIPDCIFEWVEKQTDFRNSLQDFQPDVIVSGYALAEFNGMQVLELAQQQAFFVPVIIWTGRMSEHVAVECM